MVRSLIDLQVVSIWWEQDNSFLPFPSSWQLQDFLNQNVFDILPLDTDSSRSASNEIIRPGNLLKIITQIISNFFSPGRMVKALVDNLSTLINPCRVLLIAACVGFLCNYNYSKGWCHIRPCAAQHPINTLNSDSCLKQNEYSAGLCSVSPRLSVSLMNFVLAFNLKSPVKPATQQQAEPTQTQI